jgi:ribosomal protein L31E
MAKKEEETKIVLEREYNVPLRREFLKAPNWKRTHKASRALREFLIKHMKPGLDEKGNSQVKIGKYLNEELWKKGIKNPPHHIKVIAKKDDKGVVMAELVGAPVEKKEEEKPKKKKEEKKEETKEEEKKEEEKKEKAEVLKKEVPKEQAKIPAAPKQAVRETKIPARG